MTYSSDEKERKNLVFFRTVPYQMANEIDCHGIQCRTLFLVEKLCQLGEDITPERMKHKRLHENSPLEISQLIVLSVVKKDNTCNIIPIIAFELSH